MVVSDERIVRIDELLLDADKILKFKPKNVNGNFYASPIPSVSWIADVSQFLIDNYDDTNMYMRMFNASVIEEIDQYNPQKYHLKLGCNILRKLRRYLINNPSYSINSKNDSVDQIELLCNRFHIVANKLRSRREKRDTLIINDEYDVQDLLHALLKIYFNDIRPEEWTPSYAGGSSRMDFLLKNEKIVIEVKKTRQNLKGKEIGEQLLVDIGKYGESPDCNTLVCFIYDPEELIGNHIGLENDLVKKSTDNLQIKAYIRPTGN